MAMIVADSFFLYLETIRKGRTKRDRRETEEVYAPEHCRKGEKPTTFG